MTGLALLHALAESGTAGPKLAPGLAVLLRQPEASADDVCVALQAAGISSVTLAKARALSAATTVAQSAEPERRRPGRPRKTREVLPDVTTCVEQNGLLVHASEVQP